MTDRKSNDPYDLQRFVDAQEPVFETACAELAAGRKESHWMWFIFPQLEGLGTSSMARKFAISGRAEAEAYLRHPVLGPRLRRATRHVNSVEGRSVHQIFGAPDDMKFHSSTTLFASVADDDLVFQQALRKFFGGDLDKRTLEGL
ncbi:DUF1810 domain-containing protein [Methylocapsa acidiphila]|uniref:DUF1810 domain-containing protein n=1 Tax=Methylocapsa acidiphila TaxID=133552 RepID=UPI0004044279|nr:DUF1810 domain-containing protein [Methylocapsa acidiphila]